jgi:hypothetical protein
MKMRRKSAKMKCMAVWLAIFEISAMSIMRNISTAGVSASAKIMANRRNEIIWLLMACAKISKMAEENESASSYSAKMKALSKYLA